MLGAGGAALVWLAIACVLVGFALADELPDPRVRRVFVVAGLVLLGLSWAPARASGTTGWTYLLTGAGPLLFLVGHHLLRTAFRRFKGGEPSLVFTPTIGGVAPPRLLYQRGETRPVTGWDYLYSFLLGVLMLLSVAAALDRLIAASG